MRVRSLLVAITVASVALGLSGGVALAQVPQTHVKLSGGKVVPGPGDSNGEGQCSWIIDGTRFWYLLTVKNIGTAVAATVQKGAKGTNGSAVVTLVAPSNKSSAGCGTLSSGLASNLKDKPGKYYVIVRNSKYPLGAIRSQLSS
jgi:hypothetical protein